MVGETGGLELALQTRGSYPQVLAAARWAERFGLAAFAVPDHYLVGRHLDQPALDAFAVLAGLARETERIGLVVLVSPVTFRHPAVLAKMATTIDLMAGGRFSLGVGTGWLEPEHTRFGIHFPPPAERFARLEEALRYLRAYLHGEPPGFEGSYYRIDAFEALPRPAGPVPLVVGGTGARRTPQLAGRYGDEYNVYAKPPEQMAERIEEARRAASAAGRDPAQLLLSAAGPVVVGRTGASYRAHLEYRAATAGTTPEETEEELRRSGLPQGSPQQVRRTLAEWDRLGISRCYVQLPEFDPALAEETFEVLAG